MKLQTYLNQCRERLKAASFWVRDTRAHLPEPKDKTKWFWADRQLKSGCEAIEPLSNDIAKLLAVVECLRETADRILRDPRYTSQIALASWEQAIANAEKIVAGGE